MIFQVIFILCIFQDTLAQAAFDKNAFENFMREKTAEKEGNILNLMEHILPKIQKMIEDNRSKIMIEVKEKLDAVSKDLKSYQKRSLIATSDYLQQVVKDEIEPVKNLLRSLNIAKDNFQNELTRKLNNFANANTEDKNTLKTSIKDELKAFQRTELDALVIEVKKEIIESFKSDLVTLKTALISEVTSVRDAIGNSQSNIESTNLTDVRELIKSEFESIKSSRQVVDDKLKKLEDSIDAIEKLTNESNMIPQASPRSFNNPNAANQNPNNELADLLKDKIEKLIITLKPNSSVVCELNESTMSTLESIKSVTETMNDEQEAKSDELISKLEGKIGKLLNLKLKSRSSICELNRSTKATLEAIKTATETLADVPQTDEKENELEKKLEALLTELNANTTIGFDKMNTELNTIKNKTDSLENSYQSIPGTFTVELNKFSVAEVKTIKTAIGDTLANILAIELPKLEKTLLNSFNERGAGKSGSIDEPGKLNDTTSAVSAETIKSLIQGIEIKLITELEKVEEKVLKAINVTIIDKSTAEEVKEIHDKNDSSEKESEVEDPVKKENEVGESTKNGTEVEEPVKEESENKDSEGKGINVDDPEKKGNEVEEPVKKESENKDSEGKESNVDDPEKKGNEVEEPVKEESEGKDEDQENKETE